MLPTKFDQYGLLPPKDYELTFSQLRKSLLVVGPDDQLKTWDRKWRNFLVDNMEILVQQLWQAGIVNIFINGSFVEDKDHPNDIDGYFECGMAEFVSGRLEQKLNGLDPHKAWTWDPAFRRADPDSGKKQLPMWHIYRVEFYPHYNQGSGITDKFGNELLFPAAFRQSRREYRQKGIVKVKQR